MGVKRFFKRTERESKGGDHSVTVSGYVDQDMVTHITNVEVEKVTKIEPKPLLSDAKVGEEWVDNKGGVWEIVIVGLAEPHPIRVRYCETRSISAVNLDGHHVLGNFRLVSRKPKPSEEAGLPNHQWEISGTDKVGGVGISKTETTTRTSIANEIEKSAKWHLDTKDEPCVTVRYQKSERLEHGGKSIGFFAKVPESEAIRAGEAAKAQREERERKVAMIQPGEWYWHAVTRRFYENTDKEPIFSIFAIKITKEEADFISKTAQKLHAQTTKGRGEG